MIRELPMKIRMALVKGRIVAMRQGVEAAMVFLGRDTTDDVCDGLAIHVLKAELLHLDHRDSEAQEVFETHVLRRLAKLSPDTAVLLADNGTLIAHAQLSEGDNFYHLVDQRRLLGVELRDHKVPARIHEAVRAGKHNEALALCWQQLLHAHDSLCWRRSQLAELDMARECLALGWPRESAFHGMMSCDADFIELVAVQLLGAKTSDVIRQTIDQVLPISRLTRHAVVVATLLRRITDVIPDDRVGNVVDWLTERARIQGSESDPLSESTWMAIAHLSPRLSPEQALCFVDIALDHPSFVKRSVYRRHVINSVSACLRRIDDAELPRIANSALPLALDQKSDLDYVESINLLCHLADRGDDALREQLKSALYRSEQPTSNAILMQAARRFGAKVRSTDDLDKAALQAAQKLLCQVQHLEPDEEPAKIGGFGTITKTSADGKKLLVVHIQGGRHILDALVEHRSDVSEQPLRELIGAVLQMIGNSNNVLANRIALVQTLSRLLDHVPVDLAQRAVDVLLPLASGEIIESPVGMSHAEAANPLNPFKVNFGNPIDLRGISLMTLSEIDKRYPGTVPDLHNDLLLQAMTADDPTLRALGCAAARLASELTNDEQLAVLLCTTDGNSDTATAAFSVCREHMDLASPASTMLATCLVRAGQSHSVDVRRAAAEVVTDALAADEIHGSMATRMRRLQDSFLRDVSYAVRSKIPMRD